MLVGFGGFPQGAPGGDVVTVTVAGVVNKSNPGGAVFHGIRCNADGTLDERGVASGSYAQIDSAADLIRPVTTYVGVYHVRLTVNSGSIDGGSDAVNTWIAVTTAPEWWCWDGGSSVQAANCTLEISANGGASTLDSATFGLSADGTP